MQRTKRNQTTPDDEGFAAARADAQAAKTPPTESEKRALVIEHATYIRDYKARDAREAIDEALARLHSMLNDIEREAQRETNTLEQVLYHIRHNMAWTNANVSSSLDRADCAIREMLVARTKIDILTPAPETPEVK
jgi:hypothetical protein